MNNTIENDLATVLTILLPRDKAQAVAHQMLSEATMKVYAELRNNLDTDDKKKLDSLVNQQSPEHALQLLANPSNLANDIDPVMSFFFSVVSQESFFNKTMKCIDIAVEEFAERASETYDPQTIQRFRDTYASLFPSK